MKSISIFIAITLFVAHAAFANESVVYDSTKDLCLLDINNCRGQSYYNIVEKISRLKAALEIGSKVYSQEEIKHLNYLLDEAFYAAERIDADPSQVPENKNK
ncbi:MAG: hypothetical protein HXX11_18690 [Desulfuromonadales bacterium]|nr:hypothetical protein [Desulfuromonadales bacterium]